MDDEPRAMTAIQREPYPSAQVEKAVTEDGISDAILHLDRAITRYDESLDRMAARFDDVLQPSGADKLAGSMKTPTRPQSPVASRLFGLVASIETRTDRLDELISRVDL